MKKRATLTAGWKKAARAAWGPITPAERSRGLKSRKANPAPRSVPLATAGAARMYRRFVGKEATTESRVAKPVIPESMACIGQVSVIQYIAERDGKVSEYRHPFRKNARPHLCVSDDGKLVLMIGGSFTFTEDGFVDGKP